MSQPGQPLGAFFIDIVSPASTEGTFRCLAELADRAFALADQQADLDPPSIPLGVKTRHATILYPVGNNDVEPFPVKAVLHQPALQVQQVVVNFQSKTVECEGQPNLSIEPEQIELAQEEIKPYLQDVWRRKKARQRARQLQEKLAWKDFVERLECNGILPAESCPDLDSFRTLGLCPLCETQTRPCTSCHAILCLSKECTVSQLIPFRSCSHHSARSACVSCLENGQGIPSLGQCPDCNLWFCQFELTWCLGRPTDSPDRSFRSYFHRVSNRAREHPTRPIGCSTCTGGQDRRPHCSNGKCWSRVCGYSSVCQSCSPGGGLWCTCEQCWICDDCATSPTDNCFKECPRCKRFYCAYECAYIDFCSECGRTTLCDDCAEEDWSLFEESDVAEGVTLQGECESGQCSGRICGSCLEGTRCEGCNKTFCSSCVPLRGCDSCGARSLCSICLRGIHNRQCGPD